jgi:oligopeptide/dipeptide ABC transporter ATP-binding protein
MTAAPDQPAVPPLSVPVDGVAADTAPGRTTTTAGGPPPGGDAPGHVQLAEPATGDAAVLEVRGVTKAYTRGTSWISRLTTSGPATLTALDGVDLDLRRGEILALVGESGSGKSTLAKILVGSVRPTSGVVLHRGASAPARRTTASSRRVQMVFQDPYSSLNPRLTVGAMLGELLRLHRIVPRKEVRAESIRLLNLVGMEEDVLDAYPSQFSGGQRQRLAIARALAVRPDVLIADEPVSALDVSVQATILDLFARLRAELGLSILFIAHNLAVVQHLSDRVAVMYLGRIVEVAPTAQLFAAPRHPYTRALIDSIPRMTEGSVNDEFELEGEPPSPYDVPAGCRFHPRCALASDICRSTDPALLPIGPGRLSACLKADELADIPLPEAPASEKIEEHA